MDLHELLGDSETRRNLIATGVLLLASLGLRTLLKRAVERASFASEDMRLRWLVMSRNVSLGVLLLGGTIIWAAEIQSIAISIVAIAAAIVLATKELILCMSGAVLRAGSGAYSLGDRVELAGTRGDVIDISLLSTTLLEVGPGHQRTGRAVTVPNSALLSGAVVNESFMERYVLHVVKVPIDLRQDDWEAADKALLEAGREVCAEYLEPARAFMDALSKKHGLPNLTVAPRVHLALASPNEVHLLLRVPSPVRERGRIEQAILRRYLSRYERRAEQDTAGSAPAHWP